MHIVKEIYEVRKIVLMLLARPLKVVFILMIFASLTTAWVGQSEAEMLKLGVVPQFSVRRLHAVWEPIAQAVGEQAKVTIKIIGSPSIPVFEQQFMAGVFDMVYLNPYHMVKAHQAQGYQPILRDIKRSLQGIVVVRKDSPIRSVQELDGKVIAFPAPNALGAALIPRAEFDRIYRIAFTPWYVNSHSSVYLNVMLGRAVAGGGVQQTLSQQPAHVRQELRVIYRTSQFASHPIAVHPRLTSEVRDRVQQAFVTMSHRPTGQALLANIPIEALGLASMADYQPLEAIGLEHYYVKE
jgi:phosphonate transport system substrate-binding protein